MKCLYSLPRNFAFLLALAGSIIAIPSLLAQSDNFDSGTLGPEWRVSQFSPALVKTSFPGSGTQKAFRIEASPGGGAPAAVGYYRTNVYSDFYMALDLSDWPGTDKNQAVVLFARASMTPNPAQTTGIILNYDASQYGELPPNRRQGQLQINMVTNAPPFGTKTLAVAECTLAPGRPYRLVFKGQGSRYTGQVFDYHDLTKPIVTITADDVEQGMLPGGGLIFENTFDRGVCGFLSFSRQGTTGTTDVTLDNYFAGAADPNPTAAPALPHPIAGTPTIDSRVPAERFKNFHNPADGISFTAKTYTTETINSKATKLLLNGVDLSSQLILSADSAAITGRLPGSALSANTVYSGEIIVESATGKRSTNTFWFDTFSDAYLSGPEVRTIEAEEYNFDGGQFQPDPIAVSGMNTLDQVVSGGGAGYFERAGVEGIDFHDARTSPEGTWSLEFRSADAVGLSAGMYPEVADLNENSSAPVRRSDNVRSKYAAAKLLEYVVHRTETGEWLNYTRRFNAGQYRAFLRVASFGSSAVELHRVTSNPAQENQTTVKLGTFQIPNLITRYHYNYIPLTDDKGAAITIDLSALETLRLLMAGTAGQDDRKLAINYLLLVPQSQSVKLLSSARVEGPYVEETGAVIKTDTRTITVPVQGSARFYRLSAPAAVNIGRISLAGQTATITF